MWERVCVKMISKLTLYFGFALVVFSGALQAHQHLGDLDGAHSRQVVAPEVRGCSGLLLPLQHYLHPDYIELLKTNRWLEENAGTLDRARLIELGYLVESGEKVYRIDDHNLPILDQVMPYRKLLLPKIQSGLYEQLSGVDLKKHRGIVIFLPGIGANTSHAGRILDIASTFHNGRESASGEPSSSLSSEEIERLANERRESDFGKIPMASYAFDITMNGMGSSMPFIFASEPGAVEMLRHVRLILGILNPKLHDSVFMAGRSQGGLAAIAYAAKYNDVRGVVAVNPSSTWEDVIAASLRVHDAGGKVFEHRVQLNHRAWGAYQFFTPYYQALESKTQVPILIFISDLDKSYDDDELPRSIYLAQMDGFVADAHQTRGIRHYLYSHDLWVKRNNPYYDSVAGRMGQFFAQTLRSGK